MEEPPPPPPPPPPDPPPPPPPPPRIVVKRDVAKPRTTRSPTRTRPTQIRRTRRPVQPRRRRGGRGFLVLKVLIICFLLLLLALILVPQLRNSPLQWLNPLSYRTFPETAVFTVERRTTMSGVAGYTLDTPEPSEITGQQWLISSSANPNPTVEQRYGYRWQIWNGYDGQTIYQTYTIRTRTIWWDIDAEDSLTVAEASQYDPMFNVLSNMYNHDEWRIEPNHPSVVSLARQLEIPGGSVRENLESIYKYLNVNFEYSTREGGSVKPSSQTLADRTGDCDDMSFLFVALAREMGIPSWPELGASYNSMTREWTGHGWMEVYVPTTTGGKNVTIDMVNDEFFVRGANRFSDFKSDGTGTHLEDYYLSYSYIPSKPGGPDIYDEMVDRAYDSQGTVTVKLGHDAQPISLVDVILTILLVVVGIVILVILAKSLRRRGRRPQRARR